MLRSIYEADRFGLTLDRNMRQNHNRVTHVLKTGAHSETNSSGGDSAAFEQLHDDLVAEWAPNGCFERFSIRQLARLMWHEEKLTRLPEPPLSDIEQLDGRIDDCLKRFCFVRDFKSHLSSPSAAHSRLCIEGVVG